MMASLEDEDDCIEYDDDDGGGDLDVFFSLILPPVEYLVFHLFAVERKYDQHEVFLNLKVFIFAEKYDLF